MKKCDQKKKKSHRQVSYQASWVVDSHLVVMYNGEGVASAFRLLTSLYARSASLVVDIDPRLQDYWVKS